MQIKKYESFQLPTFMKCTYRKTYNTMNYYFPLLLKIVHISVIILDQIVIKYRSETEYIILFSFLTNIIHCGRY